MGPDKTANLSKRVIQQGVAGSTLFTFLLAQLILPSPATAQDTLRQQPPPENKSGLEELEDVLHSPSVGPQLPGILKASSKSSAASRREEKDTKKSLFLLKADYGFLPQDHPAVKLLRDRLERLLPDVAPEHRPTLRVLASTGYGINAMAYPNGTVVFTPEMLRFTQNVEELDFVLLHETNHWMKKHSKKIREAQRQSIFRTLGLHRYHEYEADLAAFFQASDEKRQTSPQGAITLMERLRDLTRKQLRGTAWDIPARWDLAHGDITDRVLNMKTVTHFLDLIQLNRNLTPLDPTVSASLGKLPLGDRLSRLTWIPTNKEIEQWRNGVQGLVAQADWTLLHASMPLLYKRLQRLRSFQAQRPLLRTEQFQLEETLWLFRRVVHRWNDLFLKTYGSLSVEMQTGLQGLLLEAGAHLPVFLNPGDSILKEAGLGSLAREFQNQLKDRSALERLTQCCERITTPIDSNAFLQLVAKIAWRSLGPNAAFDLSSEKVDVPGYLQASAQMVLQAGNVAQHLGVSEEEEEEEEEEEDKLWSAQDVWTAVVLQGALILADMGQWNQWEKRYANLAQETGQSLQGTPLQISASRMGSLLAKYKAELPKAMETIRKYAEDHWGVSKIVGIREKLERILEIQKELQQIQPGTVTYEDPHQRALLVEAANLLNGLPDKMEMDFAKDLIGGRTRSFDLIVAFLSALFFDGQTGKISMSFQSAMTMVRWCQLVAPDDRTFQDLLATPPVEFQQSSLQEIDQLADAVADPSGAKAAFGISPRLKETSVRAERLSRWQQGAQVILALSLRNITEADQFFGHLETFVRRWPVVQGLYFEDRMEEKISGLTDLQREIVHQGIKFLDLESKSEEEVTLQRLLLLSFFIDNPTIQRLLQRYSLDQLVKRYSLKDAVDLALIRYASQGVLGSTQLLEFFDEKVQTPEELAFLKAAGQKWLAATQDPFAKFGKAVLGEGALELVFRKREKRTALFVGLLTSGLNDFRLREELFKYWWWSYNGELNRDLTYRIEETKDTLDPTGSIAREKPFVFSEERRDSARRQPRDYPPYYTAEELLRAAYRLGPEERYLLLRKLLSGDGGMLATPEGRELLLDEFFETYVQPNSEPEVADLLREALGALFVAAPQDELYLVLDPLLRNRFGNPPQQPGSWQPPVDRLASEMMEGEENLVSDLDHKLIGSRRQAKTELKDAIGSYLTYAVQGTPVAGGPSFSEVEELFEKTVPPAYVHEKVETFTPLKLIVEVARSMGAPGVRFLQLLGQTVEIPEVFREQFLVVYDNLRGQSKLSAWETIKRELPDYAGQIKRLGQRLGGGSLFTVYEVELTDGSREVVRVLNPNALYHAQMSIRVIGDAMETLSVKDPRYRQAKPLITLLNQWISHELEDPTYEMDDQSFRSDWENWRPNKQFRAKVTVPKSIPTGTVYVRREGLVEGQNFTSLDQFPAKERKALVALAAQHYAAQIRGSLLAAESLVHSDISPGNLRRTPEGNLAILDRGMYLKFNRSERLFLRRLSQAATAQDRVTFFVQWLWTLPENQTTGAQLNQGTIIQEILTSISDRQTDPEEAALDTLVVVQSRGLSVPLKFTLLFKNLNVLHRFAKRVGFNSLAEAMNYNAGLEEKGGITVEGAFIPSHGLLMTWYTNVATNGGLVPSSLLDILDPERDRIAVPLTGISSETTVFVEEKAGKPVISSRVIDALEAAGVKVERFTLENVPQGYSDRENVYLVDVPVGSEREWVLDPSAIVINFRSDKPGNRPNSPEELGALINVAREADRRVLWVSVIYRSDLQNAIIAIDTQL